MKYCKKCVMPDTKPDLFFDKEGVCDACRSAEAKETAIDWGAREKELEEILEKHRNKDGSNYDCIVPVSGGKDSHFQTYIIKKKYGLNPLCACFEATNRTPLGRSNLTNLKNLGVDLIVFEKNPIVYKKLCLEGFRRVGDHEWPNHLGIFTVPVRVAVNYKIPLIIWGENSQLEYGGPDFIKTKPLFNRRYLEEFTGLLGNRAEDMIGVAGIMRADMLPYIYPSDEELGAVGIKGIFLGDYMKWDAKPQVELMKKHGFSVKEDGPVEGTYTNYENLDDNMVAIHDYLKFVKFGFGRATDHACIDIRNHRLTRDEGVDLVKKYDGKFPHKGYAEFLEFFQITPEEFFKIIDSFTNKALFTTDEKGRLVRDKDGNLIKLHNDYHN